MTLAIKRAITALDAALAPYWSNWDKYEMASPPLVFDWDSAKAVTGETKFNTNDEELPKAASIANALADEASRLVMMMDTCVWLTFGLSPEKVTKQVNALRAKHYKQIMLHFNENAPEPGFVNWDKNLRIADGVMHITMEFNFGDCCQGVDVHALSKMLFIWLDDQENVLFNVLRAMREHEIATRNDSYFNTCTMHMLAELSPNKSIPLSVNFDEIATTPGKIEYATGPTEWPKRCSWVLLQSLCEDAALIAMFSTMMKSVLRDDDAKEAFAETFDAVRINLRAGPHSTQVEKQDKTLVWTFTVDMKDYRNPFWTLDRQSIENKMTKML